MALVALTLPASARWKDSASLWGQAVEVYPHDHRLCRNYGNAFFQQGRYERALQQYSLCAKRHGNGPYAKNIAITLYKLGRNKEARDILVQLARLHPEDRTVQKYLQLAGP